MPLCSITNPLQASARTWQTLSGQQKDFHIFHLLSLSLISKRFENPVVISPLPTLQEACNYLSFFSSSPFPFFLNKDFAVTSSNLTRKVFMNGASRPPQADYIFLLFHSAAVSFRLCNDKQTRVKEQLNVPVSSCYFDRIYLYIYSNTSGKIIYILKKRICSRICHNTGLPLEW